MILLKLPQATPPNDNDLSNYISAIAMAVTVIGGAIVSLYIKWRSHRRDADEASEEQTHEKTEAREEERKIYQEALAALNNKLTDCLVAKENAATKDALRVERILELREEIKQLKENYKK